MILIIINNFLLEYYGSGIRVSNDDDGINKLSSSIVNRIHMYTVQNCSNRILKFLLASIKFRLSVSMLNWNDLHYCFVYRVKWFWYIFASFLIILLLYQYFSFISINVRLFECYWALVSWRVAIKSIIFDWMIISWWRRWIENSDLLLLATSSSVCW